MANRRRRTVSSTTEATTENTEAQVEATTEGETFEVDIPQDENTEVAGPSPTTTEEATTEAPRTGRRPKPAGGLVPTGPNKTKTSEGAKPPEELAPLAKEINVRLDKAAKLESDAHDHRLAAATQLAKAKEICTRAGVGFQAWAEANIKEVNGQAVGFQVIRKLANLGEQDDPKAALDAARAAQAERAKASRDRKKEGEPGNAGTTTTTDDGAFAPRGTTEAPASNKEAPAADAVITEARKLSEADRCEVILSLFETVMDTEQEQKVIVDMVEMMTPNDRTELVNLLVARRGGEIIYSAAG